MVLQTALAWDGNSRQSGNLQGCANIAANANPCTVAVESSGIEKMRCETHTMPTSSPWRHLSFTMRLGAFTAQRTANVSNGATARANMHETRDRHRHYRGRFLLEFMHDQRRNATKWMLQTDTSSRSNCITLGLKSNKYSKLT